MVGDMRVAVPETASTKRIIPVIFLGLPPTGEGRRVVDPKVPAAMPQVDRDTAEDAGEAGETLEKLSRGGGAE